MKVLVGMFTRKMALMARAGVAGEVVIEDAIQNNKPKKSSSEKINNNKAGNINGEEDEFQDANEYFS